MMTRDCLLPIIAPLADAMRQNQSIFTTVTTLPKRFTAADRLQGISTKASATFLQAMSSDASQRAAFFETRSPEANTDLTDGLRVTFENGDIVHLRPSGNAPEFRCYTESASFARASELLALHLN